MRRTVVARIFKGNCADPDQLVKVPLATSAEKALSRKANEAPLTDGPIVSFSRYLLRIVEA